VPFSGLLEWNYYSDPVFTSFSVLIAAFTIASAASAVAGILLLGVRDLTRRLLPASGLILMTVALALVLPELANALGWTRAAFAFVAALAMVWVVDRFVYPVCPACAHSHDHAGCTTRLHGFAAPLLIAMLIHNGFDGWMLALDQQPADHAHALSMGVVAHKIPECLAFGAILAAALRSRAGAFGWAILIQAGTITGAALQRLTSAWVSPQWVAALLAIGGGVFFYLGFHAVHGEWKRRAAVDAVKPLRVE
jgi:zinc transporter ZupT